MKKKLLVSMALVLWAGPAFSMADKIEISHDADTNVLTSSIVNLPDADGACKLKRRLSSESIIVDNDDAASKKKSIGFWGRVTSPFSKVLGFFKSLF